MIKKNKSTLVIVTLSLITLTVLSIYQPALISNNNLVNISRQLALLGIFSIAQSIVLISKGLDLSQGGLIGFVSVIVAALSTSLGLPLAIFIGLISGAVIGFINGWVVSNFDVSPFVTTMGMGFLLQGLGLIISKGQPIYEVTKGYDFLGWNQFLGIPLIFWFLILVSMIVLSLERKSNFWRFIYAIGSNEKAAFLSGINVKRSKIMAYVISSFVTAAGAIFLSSRIVSGHPLEGANTSLQTVAACVIGGVSLFGGRGKLLGVILGALLLTLITNVLNLTNVSSYFQQVFVGIIIIVAVVIDKFRTK